MISLVQANLPAGIELVVHFPVQRKFGPSKQKAVFETATYIGAFGSIELGDFVAS